MQSRRSDPNQAVEILVAEDSATQAAQLSHLLEERGYTATIASNGKQALEAARNRKPTLIISDIVMPEMDGYALCKAMKTDAGLRDVPVILVTSLSSIQDIAMGLECGADNFIRKPYDPGNLLSRIDYILSNRELRASASTRSGLEIYLGGKKHLITAQREQILDLLVSSYEEAIQVNEALKLRETEVRALNADLERRAAQLEAANKELESFSYSVSHDLRSPLRAIDGFSTMLEEDYAHRLDDEGRRVLATIRESAQRMGQLIEDLLQLSRLGRKPMSAGDIDMTALAAEALKELQAGAPTPARCMIEPLPAARCDPSLLRQVWINLLSNAIKYSARREGPVIRVSGYPEGAENVYCVADNGAGFDMRYYDKLFGVFQRLHGSEQFSGTGVGLAIVQRVVARHGGRVWAKGKVNEGASFYFALPRET